jgi:hypothetical protein
VKITFHTTEGATVGTGVVSGAVPSQGDTFMNGSTEYSVQQITWQFATNDVGGELECFVTVRAGAVTPWAADT